MSGRPTATAILLGGPFHREYRQVPATDGRVPESINVLDAIGTLDVTMAVSEGTHVGLVYQTYARGEKNGAGVWRYVHSGITSGV